MSEEVRTLSPHSVALCLLIRGYLNPGEHDPPCSWQLRQSFGNSLLRMVRLVDTLTESSVVQLLQHLEGFIMRRQRAKTDSPTAEPEGRAFITELRTSLIVQLRATSQFPEGLAQMFDTIACMVTTSTNMRAEESIGADDNSVMGFFLRRCWADYTCLSFGQQCALLEDIQRYAAHDASPGPRPRIALERRLAASLRETERTLGTAPREQLEAPLRALTGAAARLADVDFARYQADVLHNDVTGAIDRSHAYFNRDKSRVPSVGVVASGEAAPVPRERQRLQAAAPQAAVTRARLGQVQAALRDLTEAMKMAQQANDDASLAHCLAVLCQVTVAATPGTVEVPTSDVGATASGLHQSHVLRLLNRLLVRSQELALPHLVAYARVAQAKERLCHPLKKSPWEAQLPPPHRW